jgi:hypothetical protein
MDGTEFKSRSGQGIFTLPNILRPARGLTGPLLLGVIRLFSVVKRPERDDHSHLTPRWGLNGAILLLPPFLFAFMVRMGQLCLLYSGPAGYDRLDIRPTWVTTKIFVLTYDQISSYDPRQRQRGEHIFDIKRSSLRALAVFALFCRRDHGNSSYQSMYSINKYRVTEKGWCIAHGTF